MNSMHNKTRKTDGEELRNEWATESLKYTSLCFNVRYHESETEVTKLILKDKSAVKACDTHMTFHIVCIIYKLWKFSIIIIIYRELGLRNTDKI